jgi:mannosyl-3-phosphoglycerate phosphatase
MGNDHPFISENGGGIFIPKNYFDFSFPFHKTDEHYQVIELGTPYEELRDALRAISEQTGAMIRGFGDLSAAEIAAQSGLPLHTAQLAKQREYDEPFIFIGSPALRIKTEKLIQERGLNYFKGSRYDHLTGPNHKGKAVHILTDLFRKKYKKVITVGLGDSDNDRTMLESVNYPVLVQKKDGSYEQSIQLKSLHKAPGIGPAGWGPTVLRFLSALQD